MKITLIGFVLLLIFGPVTLHYRAKWKLQAFRRHLVEQGEKLEVTELIPATIPNGYSNGTELLKANNAIGGRLRELTPPILQFVTAGKVRLCVTV